VDLSLGSQLRDDRLRELSRGGRWIASPFSKTGG